jgi:hypothetical protein
MMSKLKKLLSGVLCVVVVMVGMVLAVQNANATGTGTSSASGAAGLSDVAIGWYRIRSVYLPNQCMQADPAVALDPNANPMIYVAPCNDTIFQRWLFGSTNPTYPAAYREVRNGAGRCFDADNRGGRLTGIIHLYTCNRSKNQAWAFSEPPGFGVACGFVAVLCDWRPAQSFRYTENKGYQVFYYQTTGGGADLEWQLEPVV